MPKMRHAMLSIYVTNQLWDEFGNFFPNRVLLQTVALWLEGDN